MTDEKIVQPRNGKFQHFQISDNEIEERLQAVVSITTTIPEHAETAEILGTNRSGSGVFINQMGLIVTVGYLIAEAEQIWISTANGETVLADTVVYDYESGLALLKPLNKISIPTIAVSDSNREISAGDGGFILAGFGGIEQSVVVDIKSCDSFTGY